MRDRIIVRLPTEWACRGLIEAAERDLRDPSGQAAFYIVQGIKADGILPSEPDPPNNRADQTAALTA